MGSGCCNLPLAFSDNVKTKFYTDDFFKSLKQELPNFRGKGDISMTSSAGRSSEIMIIFDLGELIIPIYRLCLTKNT